MPRPNATHRLPSCKWHSPISPRNLNDECPVLPPGSVNLIDSASRINSGQTPGETHGQEPLLIDTRCDHHRHTRAVGACRHVSPLDNALLAGPFPFPGGVDTNVLARGSLVTYAAPDTTTLKKRNYVAHYGRGGRGGRRSRGGRVGLVGLGARYGRTRMSAPSRPSTSLADDPGEFTEPARAHGG